MSTPPAEGLREVQARFAAHLRDPAAHPAPPEIEDRRMGIYRGLVYRTIEGFVRGGFPVLHSLLDEDSWHRLVRDFMARHRCRSPYFLEISQEFIRYLQDTRGPRPEDPPFLLELAHYEWVELALDVADVEPDWAAIDHNGDLLEGVPRLSPVAWSLSYRFPVHRIGPAFQPPEAPAQATWLLVYRARDERVKFMEINSVSARLLELLGAGGQGAEPELTGRQALEQLAHELQHGDAAGLVAFGHELLCQLQAAGVVLGVRR